MAVLTNTGSQGDRGSVFSVNALNSLAKLLLHPCSYSLKVILDTTDRLILPLPGTQRNDASLQDFRSRPVLSLCANISALITAQPEIQARRGILP